MGDFWVVRNPVLPLSTAAAGGRRCGLHHRRQRSGWHGAEGFETSTIEPRPTFSISLDPSLFLFTGPRPWPAARTTVPATPPFLSPSLSLDLPSSLCSACRDSCSQGWPTRCAKRRRCWPPHFSLSLVGFMELGFENPPPTRMRFIIE